MADPVTTVTMDGMTVGNVSMLGALGFLLLWAFRETLGIMFSWIRRKLFGPPNDAVGSSSSTSTKAAVHTDTIENRPMLEDHFFFVTTEELLARRVPALRCGCAVRSEMLRDMMTDYVCAWRDLFSEFMAAEINRDGFEARGSKYAGQFANRVATLLLDLQNEITDRWMRRGVPTEAILAFRRWDSKLVETLTNHSEKIAQSAFFPTNRTRLIALLTQHATFLAMMLLEARYVLRRMNGTLDGLTYNRGVIGPIDDPHGDEAPHEPPGTDSDPPPDMGNVSKLRPRPGGNGGALTRKQRSGEWRETRPTPSEMRLPRQTPDGGSRIPADEESGP